MIHFDTKQLARFERIGHRITGGRRQGWSCGDGYENVRVAIVACGFREAVDATRLADVEMLPVEQKTTTVGLLTRAVGCFREQGITGRRMHSDNRSSYRSGKWRKACGDLDFKPVRTRPDTPRTNGKAERFIETHCRERACAMAFQNSYERYLWLPRYLAIDNRLRKHYAL
jgi:hypothetical protein